MKSTNSRHKHADTGDGLRFCSGNPPPNHSKPRSKTQFQGRYGFSLRQQVHHTDPSPPPSLPHKNEDSPLPSARASAHVPKENVASQSTFQRVSERMPPPKHSLSLSYTGTRSRISPVLLYRNSGERKRVRMVGSRALSLSRVPHGRTRWIRLC